MPPSRCSRLADRRLLALASLSLTGIAFGEAGVPFASAGQHVPPRAVQIGEWPRLTDRASEADELVDVDGDVAPGGGEAEEAPTERAPDPAAEEVPADPADERPAPAPPAQDPSEGTPPEGEPTALPAGAALPAEAPAAEPEAGRPAITAAAPAGVPVPGRSGPAASKAPEHRARRAGRPRKRRTERTAAMVRIITPAPLPAPGALDDLLVPAWLMPIYERAGERFGVAWEILGAINQIETAYGRHMGVSPAGAIGWMQFMPGTWQAYGVDGDGDGDRDADDPTDAIFSAARYLQSSGYATDVRGALLRYNPAGWYADAVLLRAHLIKGRAPGAWRSTTGLTDGRPPLAGDLAYDASTPFGITGVRLRVTPGTPILAVRDGTVVASGHSARLGHYVRLRDIEGNTYTYGRLTGRGPRRAAVVRARLLPAAPPSLAPDTVARIVAGGPPPLATTSPERARAQLPAAARDRTVRSGAVLGHSAGRRLVFEIDAATAGRLRTRATRSIVDGWRLMRATARLSPAMRRSLTRGAVSPGAAAELLRDPALLARRVLEDPRIAIYPCGRDDIAAGRIDPRVLAVLAYLAANDLAPTVSSLTCGRRSLFTASGNLSAHPTGQAVDISAINGTPVLGHQGPGSVTDRAVARLLALGGDLRPAQIITLARYAGADNTLGLADHDDHIHVGFSGA